MNATLNTCLIKSITFGESAVSSREKLTATRGNSKYNGELRCFANDFIRIALLLLAAALIIITNKNRTAIAMTIAPHKSAPDFATMGRLKTTSFI